MYPQSFLSIQTLIRFFESATILKVQNENIRPSQNFDLKKMIEN